MNLYDPAERTCYVHLSTPAEARTTVAGTTAACSLLPSGYANQSPRTRSLVRVRPVSAPVRMPRTGVPRTG